MSAASRSCTPRRARGRLLLSALLPLAVTTLLAACGGGSASPEAPAPAPAPTAPPARPAVPTAIGEPFGTPVIASIGPAGGSVTSADGALVVDVPAGAFDREREVVIQEITNHAHGRVGRAWRITPEGLNTPQAMTLRFRYTEADLLGTTRPLLGIATQAADGTWRVYRRPEHDAASGTLSIRTRHFSDWSKVSGAQLLPGEAAVRLAMRSTCACCAASGSRAETATTHSSRCPTTCAAAKARRCGTGRWGAGQ
jgi:hypothetical protein